MEAALKAIAEPRRRLILRLVWDAERSAGDIASHFDVSRPAISQHLTVLRTAGLVTERRDGRHIHYRVAPKGLTPLFDWLGHYRTFWDERFENLERLLQETGDE